MLRAVLMVLVGNFVWLSLTVLTPVSLLVKLAQFLINCHNSARKAIDFNENNGNSFHCIVHVFDS